jgi:outer membrane protein OmpA-like peptidoglycan-associated protein
MKKIVVVLALVACASTAPPPHELLDARAAYARAMAGPAARVTPNQVREAQDALAFAEQGRSTDEKRGRAYVALRKAETAEAAAQAILAAERRNDVDREIVSLQQKRSVVEGVAEGTQRAVDSGNELPAEAPSLPAAPPVVAAQPASPAPASTAAADAPSTSTSTSTSGETETVAASSARGLENREVRIPIPRAAVASAREVRDAYDRLTHVASVVDNGSKGWVVSFAGPAFAPGDAGLLPDVATRLDAVATAIRATTAKDAAVVEVASGDAGPQVGAQLSQRRAEAVKMYLVSRGVEPGRVVARAVGGERAAGPVTGLGADRLDIRLPPPDGR